MAFNPDQFLSDTAAPATPAPTGGFNPDSFLAQTAPAAPLATTMPNLPTVAKSSGDDYDSKATDPLEQRLLENAGQAASGYMTASGLAGLGKGALGLGSRLFAGKSAAPAAVDSLQAVKDSLSAKYGPPAPAAKALSTDDLLPIQQHGTSGPSLTAEAAMKSPVPPTAPPIDIAAELQKHFSGYADKAKSAIEQPGVIPAYASRIAQNMTGKVIGMGGRGLQNPGVDQSQLRAINQYALDNDYISPFKGSIGMEQKVKDALTQHGDTIGALRDAGSQAAKPDVKSMVDALTQASQKYATGTKSAEFPAFGKAVQDLKAVKNPDFRSIAQVATDLNNYAAKNKMMMPNSASTDAANLISQLNNSQLAKVIGPEKYATYQDALRNYGANKKLGMFMNRAGKQEMTGKPTAMDLVKDVSDIPAKAAYKLGANVLNKVGKSNASTLPEFFEQLAHHTDELGDED